MKHLIKPLLSKINKYLLLANLQIIQFKLQSRTKQLVLAKVKCFKRSISFLIALVMFFTVFELLSNYKNNESLNNEIENNFEYVLFDADKMSTDRICIRDI
jgi:hypothetical protein